VVVIEEAAEVLEAHALTSFSADTEHIILIGACCTRAPSSSAASTQRWACCPSQIGPSALHEHE
jgi:hypothetical protein